MQALPRAPTSPLREVGQVMIERLGQMISGNKIANPKASGQLPAVLMRTGTSKGLFVHRHHLPAAPEAWPRVLSAAMGSYNADKRQLDGLGGASSTTSKAAIISPSSRADADVDYTFAQIAVGQNKVDLKGSCGNVCSGVGAFALDEGLVRAKPKSEETVVRVHDTNTGAIIEQKLHVNPLTGTFDPEGTFSIAGYSGAGSPITLQWKDCAGTVGKRLLFPSGNRADTIALPASEFGVEVQARASLVDATNPFVFVDASSLPAYCLEREPDDPKVIAIVEGLRCRAAVMYGLASTVEEAHKTRAIPKIALLHEPGKTESTLLNTMEEDRPCVRVVPYSMGKPHPSFQLTGVLCLSVALSYPGTVAAAISRRTQGLATLHDDAQREPEVGKSRKIVAHPSGVAEAITAHSRRANGEVGLDGVSVRTTAQRLFKGEVYV